MQFQQIRSATSIVTFGGKRFLIDPMLADQGAYPSIPNTSDTGRGNPDCPLPCPKETLFDVDAVIATHLHFDHFDEEAFQKLPKHLPIFSPLESEAQLLRTRGFSDVRILAADGTVFHDVTLYATPCDHGTSHRATALAYKGFGVTGDASGVVFKSAQEKTTFYLVGDSIYCNAVAEVIRGFRPGVVAVNAGGAQFPSGHLLIMNAYDVLSLMKEFPDVAVIAAHVEGVSHATVTRPMLRRFAEEHDLKQLHIPDDGETLAF